jgi:hypothetical protein
MRFSTRYIICVHWIHVMNYESVEDFITFDPEVAALISGNNVVSDLTPLPGCIELLVNVAIETKSRTANNALEGQISEAIFEGFEST